MTALWLIIAVAASTPNGDSPDPKRAKFGKQRLLIRTNVGDMSIAFYRDAAPSHVLQLRHMTRLGMLTTAVVDADDDGVRLRRRLTDRELMNATQVRAIAALPTEPHAFPIVRGSVISVHPNPTELEVLILSKPIDRLDGNMTLVGVLDGGEEVVGHISTLRGERAGRFRVSIEQTRFFGGDAGEAAPLRGPLLPVPRLVRVDLWRWLGLAAVLLLAALLLVLQPPPATRRWLRTAGLTLVLVLAFPLFVYLAAIAVAWELQWLSVCIFVGVAVLVRVMASYESPPASKPYIGQ